MLSSLAVRAVECAATGFRKYSLSRILFPSICRFDRHCPLHCLELYAGSEKCPASSSLCRQVFLSTGSHGLSPSSTAPTAKSRRCWHMISACSAGLCRWYTQLFRRRRSLSGDDEVAGDYGAVCEIECGRLAQTPLAPAHESAASFSRNSPTTPARLCASSDIRSGAPHPGHGAPTEPNRKRRSPGIWSTRFPFPSA
jgi:hypothetical protein